MRLVSLLLITAFFSLGSTQAQSVHPILKAIKKGDLAKIITAVEMGKDLNKTYEPGYTPLCAAVKYQQLEIINFLIKAEVDLNKISNAKTPLMYAAKYGHLEIVKLLLQRGAKQEIKSPKGRTALDYAKKYEQETIVNFLQKNKE